MKTKILLFALLCGALSAQSVTAYQSTLSAADNERITTELAGVVSFGPNFPSATITWDHENPDPDPWKHNQPTKDSAYIMTMDEGFKLTIKGRVLVTTQEAADVVKAMEILSSAIKHWGAPVPDADDPKYEGEDGARRYLVEYVKMSDKYKSELKWARSILELWKKKLEGAK